MNGQGSAWPSVVVALGFLASVTIIFATAIVKNGVEEAIKVWGAIGTLVGVLVGAIPSYFFHQAAQRARSDTGALLAAADEKTIEKARTYGFGRRPFA